MCCYRTCLRFPVPVGAIVATIFASAALGQAPPNESSPERSEPAGEETEASGSAVPAAGESAAPEDAQTGEGVDGGSSPAEERQSEAGDGNAQTAPVIESGELARVLDRVHLLRTERGRYGRGLDKALRELGYVYREAGERLLAADAFKQALFVARANYGLYSSAQIPALKELIKENKALGNSQAVIDNYFLMYWIHKRQYGAQNPRLLPIIDEVSQAQSEIFLDDDQGMDRASFMERRRILEDAVDIVEANFGEHDPRMAGVLNRVAWANFALARQTGKLLHYREYKAAQRGGTVFVDESVAQSFALIDEAVRRGGSALDRVEDLFEDRYEEDPVAAAYPLAIARVHLGDWELLFGAGTGRREYSDAYDLLMESEEGEAVVQGILGEPQMLPAPVEFPGNDVADKEDDKDPPPDDRDRIIELAIDVAFTGRVRKVEIVDAPSELKEAADNLVSYMELQRFRPKVVEGRPVNAEISRRYYVKDDGTVVLMDRLAEEVGARASVDGGNAGKSGMSAGQAGIR